MKKIKKIKNSEILSLALEFEKYISSIKNIIKLNNKWDENNFYEIEIKKCFLRSVIRYSNLSFKLQNEILEELNLDELFKDYSIISYVYPMIHLSHDKMEEGKNLHFDQNDNNPTFTCWLPLTSNNYCELKIFKYENFFINFFRKIISKINYFNLFNYSLRSEIGSIYLWSGMRLHRGCLNISNNLSCAIQMKISKNKLLKEIFYDKSQVTNKINFYDQNSLKLSDIKALYVKFINLTQFLYNLELSDQMSDLLKKINLYHKVNLVELNEIENKIISFSLSVLSQRLRTSQYKNIKYKSLSFIFDFASRVFGLENPVVLSRLKKDIKFFFKKDFEDKDINNLVKV